MAASEVVSSAAASIAAWMSMLPPHWTVRVIDIILAYGGVICIVLEGFPDSLERFKRRLEAAHSRGLVQHLCTENMGSKWAKITVAAPADQAQVTEQDWYTVRDALRKFCRDENIHQSEDGPCTARAPTVHFEALSLVQFSNRTLERRSILTQLTPQHLGGVVDEPVDMQSHSRGRDVAQEFHDDHRWPEYVKSGIIQRLQTHRHYDAHVEGVTAVCFVAHHDSHFAELLSRLQVALAARASDAFAWFPMSSLHMTVRGVV